MIYVKENMPGEYIETHKIQVGTRDPGGDSIFLELDKSGDSGLVFSNLHLEIIGNENRFKLSFGNKSVDTFLSALSELKKRLEGSPKQIRWDKNVNFADGYAKSGNRYCVNKFPEGYCVYLNNFRLTVFSSLDEGIDFCQNIENSVK